MVFSTCISCISFNLNFEILSCNPKGPVYNLSVERERTDHQSFVNAIAS